MNDLFEESEECAFIFTYDALTDSLQVDAYTENPHTHSADTLSALYLSAHSLDPASSDPSITRLLDHSNLPSYFVYDPKKKPYKPVAKKVKAQLATLPENFRIKREIIGDPLASMPTLNPNPPPFTPNGRYTQTRKDKIDEIHSDNFLTEQERLLMHDFISKQNEGFAWEDSERGKFRTDFFPPVEFPVIPHKPWVEKNIPIPPGVYKEVCKIIKTKIDAGVYERSNSSYRSRWFCILKKDGKSLRPVHSLESLNKVTIQHSGVPPIPEHLAEQFAARSCGAVLDLYVGYDERLIAESSRDYTTFQTPFGALRLVTLPMGWTNSIPIFHEDITFILQEEIPHNTLPYIDDVAIKGPKSQYIDKDGNPETIPENPGIRRFIWEHFQNLNRIVQRMKYCGGTFSGLKSTLCAREITVLGHRCTPEGRLPDKSRLAAIAKWTKCANLTEVRAFLGTIGVCRIFIKDFAKKAHHLNKLTRNGVPFEFGPDQEKSMEELKRSLFSSPALRPIDYESSAPVILAVDTSHIAIGYYLTQCDEKNPKKRYYNRFNSITLNDRESQFSQPKLELYGLYRALRALKIYLIGVRNLIIEVDAQYIKGMLQNPDIAPNATINRWIVSITLFHFTLVHVPSSKHGPDGLSRRQPQEGDDPQDQQDDFDDWVDRMHGFIHIINDNRPVHSSSQGAISTMIQTFSNNDENDGTPHALDETTPTTSKNPREPIDINSLVYMDIPRPHQALREEEKLCAVIRWHADFTRPSNLSDEDYTRFVRYSLQFFKDGPRLWRKDSHGAHKLVLNEDKRIRVMRAAHDDLGHKGFYATRAHIAERFWWPHMHFDIKWFVHTCFLCQTRQTTQILLPPTVASPVPIFSRI